MVVELPIPNQEDLLCIADICNLIAYYTFADINKLINKEDLLCIADREGKQVECVGAGLRSLSSHFSS